MGQHLPPWVPTVPPAWNPTKHPHLGPQLWGQSSASLEASVGPLLIWSGQPCLR